MPQTPMTVRIDSQQKAMFDSLCEQFGMSANTAINIFVRQVIRLRRIPFIISATETDEDIRAKAIEAFQSLRKEAETSMEPEMTLEESVWKTFQRDLLRIFHKIKHVAIPTLNSKKSEELQNWDLWGPLLICLVLCMYIYPYNP